ncbi:Pre-rRNA-processing protein TSR2 [Pleurostoma richardsiae]|uniref:Pre-rRNA-processing protein TSR2 n=1 Tax=Pleurostoma richardsiae TaxID=41990 RepID=A0AA38RJZ9_9PEZI|nr:Pre-rRNA-processing protein TSR2 [Pleurostoma richardsiae]
MATASGSEAPSLETRQTTFEQGVALSLNLWPALTLAVQNQWGGPDSADKRDWFAGAVVDLFPSLSSAPAGAAEQKDDDLPDTEYVETFLLQVMLDEFEVNVDDESGYDVAGEIVRVRAECAKGQFDEVEGLRRRWQAKKGQKVEAMFKKGQDEDGDTDWDTEDDDDDGSDEDVDMDEAPELVAAKREKTPPEVDEDGFTKVTRKKR